jgi:beta-mannosidase
VARLSDAAGASLAEAFHFPQGRAAAMADPGLSLAMETDAHGQPVLALRAERLAQSVHIAAEAFLPDDDWFHLAPGAGRRISLKGRGVPRGIVTALNGAVPVAFG